jgi:transposase-like protein
MPSGPVVLPYVTPHPWFLLEFREDYSLGRRLFFFRVSRKENLLLPFLTSTMVNRRISSDLKERALALWEAGWSRSDICYAFKVSPRSLYCWPDIFEEFGTVTKPPSPLRGRDRIVSLAVLDAAKEILYFHGYAGRATMPSCHLSRHWCISGCAKGLSGQ